MFLFPYQIKNYSVNMKQNNSNWFSVMLIIQFAILFVCSSALNFEKSNDTQTHLFPVSLIHINDFHARFEETNWLSLECKMEANDVCIGGYARIVSTVKQLQKTRSNPIYLNGGDNYAGTIWFTYGKSNVTSYFLNMLKADVMTIGNHEFDHGIVGLLPFLDAIQSPIVLANVDISKEPQLNGKFMNSTIITRSGRKIGIIGIIASNTNTISKTGKIKFLDEVETVRREADKLDKEGINIIIVLSHCGIDVDLKIAREAGSKIDVIVGAHTHTFMYTGPNPPGPDKPSYDYPTVVSQNNGHNVLIVQASAFAKYVGDLTVYFDELGEPTRWIGQPIFLANDITPDEHILEMLQPWKEQFQNVSQEVIGSSGIFLDNSNCLYSECLMGNVIADAFLRSYRVNTNDTKPAVAFIQSGGIRTAIPKGPITFGDALMVLPFGNRVCSFDILGRYIWEALEYSSTLINDENTNLNHMIHISGIKMQVNATKPEGSRVNSVEILCEECTPVQYKPLDPNRYYSVVATDFLANGGNDYTMFAEHQQNFKEGDLDVDVLVAYFKSIQKLENVEIDRITVLN